MNLVITCSFCWKFFPITETFHHPFMDVFRYFTAWNSLWHMRKVRWPHRTISNSLAKLCPPQLTLRRLQLSASAYLTCRCRPHRRVGQVPHLMSKPATFPICQLPWQILLHYAGLNQFPHLLWGKNYIRCTGLLSSASSSSTPQSAAGDVMQEMVKLPSALPRPFPENYVPGPQFRLLVWGTLSGSLLHSGSGSLDQAPSFPRTCRLCKFLAYLTSTLDPPGSFLPDAVAAFPGPRPVLPTPGTATKSTHFLTPVAHDNAHVLLMSVDAGPGPQHHQTSPSCTDCHDSHSPASRRRCRTLPSPFHLPFQAGMARRPATDMSLSPRLRSHSSLAWQSLWGHRTSPRTTRSSPNHRCNSSCSRSSTPSPHRSSRSRSILYPPGLCPGIKDVRLLLNSSFFISGISHQFLHRSRTRMQIFSDLPLIMSCLLKQYKNSLLILSLRRHFLITQTLFLAHLSRALSLFHTSRTLLSQP